MFSISIPKLSGKQIRHAGINGGVLLYSDVVVRVISSDGNAHSKRPIEPFVAFSYEQAEEHIRTVVIADLITVSKA